MQFKSYKLFVIIPISNFEETRKKFTNKNQKFWSRTSKKKCKPTECKSTKGLRKCKKETFTHSKKDVKLAGAQLV